MSLLCFQGWGVKLIDRGGVKEGSFWIEGDFEEMGTWLHNPPTSDQGVFLTYLGKTCLEGGLDLMGFFSADARNCYQHTILLLWIIRVWYFPENRYICSKNVHIKTTPYESENSIMLIQLIINMCNKTHLFCLIGKIVMTQRRKVHKLKNLSLVSTVAIKS